MRRLVAALASILLLASCSKKTESQTQATSAPAAAPSARKVDSAIANSKLPGARAVGRAMESADQATARQRMQDSLLR